jgi:hypothetical protein
VCRVVFSISIDAVSVPNAVQLDTSRAILVGGAFPQHVMRIDTGAELTADSLKRKIEDASKRFPAADEIKIAVVSAQTCRQGVCPFAVIVGRPQTNNEKSDFNDRIFEWATDFANGQHNNATFLSVAVDGLGTESVFVRKTITNFLDGDCDSSALVDSNHNMKSFRYQFIGGPAKHAVCLGCCVMDAGLLLDAGIPEQLWRITDWASDLLVLRLASGETIGALDALKKGNPSSVDSRSVALLSLTLFFVRLRLFCVNTKKLSAHERVAGIWASMLWIDSLSGVSIITKRNMICEAISLVFLVMRDDISAPRLLTTEPCEHTFGMWRQLIKEFTVLDALRLYERMERLWKALYNSGLKRYRSARKGYSATFERFSSDTQDLQESRQRGVKVNTTAGPEWMGTTTKQSVSLQIWEGGLADALNFVSSNMKELFGHFGCVNTVSAFASKYNPSPEGLRDLRQRFVESMGGSASFDNMRVQGDAECEEGMPSVTNVERRESLQQRLVQDAVKYYEGHQSSALDEGMNELINDVNNKDLEDNDQELESESESMPVKEGLQQLWTAGLSELPEKAAEAACRMHMYEREKGHDDSQRKHQTITLRYFNKKVPLSRTEHTVDELFRGVVVELNNEPSFSYLVMSVYDKHYNKYYMRSKSLPKKISAKGNQVKLGVCRVVITSIGDYSESGKPYRLDLPVCDFQQHNYFKLVPASMVAKIIMIPAQQEE